MAMTIYELIKVQKWDISERWATRKHNNKVSSLFFLDIMSWTTSQKSMK